MLHNNELENEFVCWGVCSLLIPILLFSGINGFTQRVIASSSQPYESRLNTEGGRRVQTDQVVQPQSGGTRTKKSDVSAKPAETENQEFKHTPKTSKDLETDNFVPLPDPKMQKAMSLLEGVIIRTHRISPIEYRILVEVEAGTIVWQFDKDRSLSVLKNAIGVMREFFDSKEESTAAARLREGRYRKLRFVVFRKIAGLKTDLPQELLFENSPSDKRAEAVHGEWTDFARAVMSLATEQIKDDPKSAARLFEQSLSLGTADWTTFLEKLSQRDNGEAERTGTVLIDRLRDSSITSIALRNLGRFVLAPDRSQSFREHFFQSVAIRLRRVVLPVIPTEDLEDGLRVAREMGRWAAVHAPKLGSEFGAIAIVFEGALAARSLPNPGPESVRMLDVSTTFSAKPGDTTGISDAVARVRQLADPGARDKQYQKLAQAASQNADIGLAQEIMSKIDSESVRFETTALIYNPVVKKAIGESDWSRAQEYASGIHEPLARTLAFDSIAQAMSKSNQDKQVVINVYREAVRLLDQDFATERVAKAYLMLAKPLYSLDRDRAIDVIKSSAYALNKLEIKDQPLEESSIEQSVATWVRYADRSLTADEILNLPDLVASAFGDLARRNVDDALSVAEVLHNEGIYSMAQLAIGKVLLAEAKTVPGRSQGKQKDRR